MRKAFLILVPVLFALAIGIKLAIYWFPSFAPMSLAMSVIWLIAVIWNLIYMYQKGTFKRSLMKRLSFLALAVLIIGGLFKIQHWPGSSGLILGSVCLLAIFYTIHFLGKQDKRLLDWAKCLYVISTLALINILAFHLPFFRVMNWTDPLIGLVTFGIFYMEIYREAEQVLFSLSNEKDTVFESFDGQ